MQAHDSMPAAPRRIAAGSLPPWTPLAAGFLIMAVPTLVSLARQSWADEAGTQGPIVLATGVWLLFHTMRTAPGRSDGAVGWRVVGWGAAASCAIYVFGRAYDFLALEVLGLYGVFLALVYRIAGGAGFRRLAFPLFYLGFVIPLPGALIRWVTGPLKTLVSQAATAIVDAAGYPVARQGVSITVAQYQFMVEDACSGLNSLTGMVAISLFYIYVLHRSSPAYSLVLMAAVIPLAVAANILRVLVLILLTYHFGDAAAQGFMHATTGLVLYGGAIGLILAFDTILRRFWRGQPHA